ncbi:MAG: TRAP transporter substrate-binding protein [Verrucomicrobia bacterium]|nr:TRAP transporter substrate-binding protein [Verrucomicrobiota bacterium]
MLNIRRFIATGAAGTLLASAGLTVHAQVKWDLSTAWPDGNFHTKNANRFAQEVSKATADGVQISVKSGGQLGFKGPDHLRAVRDGLVPMADVLNIQQIGDEPILGIEGIPFIAGSATELKVLHKHIRPIYEKTAMKNNQKVLYMVPWPTQYLHTKIQASSIDQLKGIKIRVPDKGAQDMLNTIGMNAVLLPWGEVIPALASGAVEGVSTSSVSGVDGKFWEFLKVSHATNHVWSSQMVTVNLDAWKKIKPAQQKAIVALAAKLEPAFWDTSLQADTDSVAKLKSNGMTIASVPAPMMKELRSRTKAQMEEFLKKVPAARAPVMAYLKEMKR